MDPHKRQSKDRTMNVFNFITDIIIAFDRMFHYVFENNFQLLIRCLPKNRADLA